jgi:hypothetical protein
LLYILAPVVPDLAWYIDVRHQLEPALVITHLFPDSVAMRSRTINGGEIIVEVNGRLIRTLEELRDALDESIATNLLTLKTKNKLFVVFPFDAIMREEEKLARNFCYPMTKTMQDLRRKAHEQAQEALQKNNLIPKPVGK